MAYRDPEKQKVWSRRHYLKHREQHIADAWANQNRLKDVDIRNLLEKVSPSKTPFRLVRRVKLPSFRKQFALPPKIIRAKKIETRRLKSRKYVKDWQRLHKANLRLLKILKQAEQA
jgi:hypothetical protein